MVLLHVSEKQEATPSCGREVVILNLSQRLAGDKEKAPPR